MNQNLLLAAKLLRQTNFAKQHLTDGFTTKRTTNVNKLDIAVAHKKVLQHNKNVKNANASNDGRQKRTTNAQHGFGKSGGFLLRMTVFRKFEVRASNEVLC